MTSRRSNFALSAGGVFALAAVGAASQVSSQVVSAQDGRDLEQGKAVYEHWCAPCHAPGPGHPGTQSLQLKYNGSLPAVLMERTDLPPETIKSFVRQGILSMAPFRKTEITDAELEDLAAYLTQK